MSEVEQEDFYENYCRTNQSPKLHQNVSELSIKIYEQVHFRVSSNFSRKLEISLN